MLEEDTTVKKEEALLVAIRQGNRKVLQEQYEVHRTAFMDWGKRRYQCEPEALVDVYQEAFIVLYQNLVSGQLDKMSCSIRTYIFSVAKNLLFKQFRRNTRTDTSQGDQLYLLADEDLNIEEKWVLTDQQKSLRDAIQSMGKVCQELITLYYYYGLDQESIMQRMQYKNTQTVKSQKVRCMRQLEKLAKSRFLGELME